METYVINKKEDLEQFRDEFGYKVDGSLDVRFSLVFEGRLVVDKILKPDSFIYVFGTWKTEPVFREIFEKFWTHKNNIIWVKNNWTAGDLKSQYGQQYELIMMYVKGRPEFREKRYSDVWNFDRVCGDKQIHQNQKPLDMLERIILNSTDEGDVVLDSFMGSGGTGVVCKENNRSFIGMEISEHHFENAKKRINSSNKKEFNLF